MFEKKINIVEHFLSCFVYKTPEIIAYASYKIDINFGCVSPIKTQQPKSRPTSTVTAAEIGGTQTAAGSKQSAHILCLHNS